MRVSSIYRPVPLVMILALSVSAARAEDPTYPQENPLPCLILMDQIADYARNDPNKGLSQPSFTHLDRYGTDEEREERENSFFWNAFAPGRGKAQFILPVDAYRLLPDGSDLATFDELVKAHNITIPDDLTNFLQGYSPDYWYLPARSLLIVRVTGGTDVCYGSVPYQIIQRPDGATLQGLEPSFGEGDLCGDSDLALVDIEGEIYLWAGHSIGPAAIEKRRPPEGRFEYRLHLFPIDHTKDESLCAFGILFKLNNPPLNEQERYGYTLDGATGYFERMRPKDPRWLWD